MSTADNTTGTVGRRPDRRARVIGVVGAVVAACVLWGIAQVLGIDLVVVPANGQPDTVELPIVIQFALVPSLLGWAALEVLERVTRRARTIWTVLAVVVLVVSMVPPLTADATTATRIVLALMHITVAAVLIPMLRGSTSDRPAS